MMREFHTIGEIVQTARAQLGPEGFAGFAAGVESEITSRRNRQALDSLALRRRVLVNVSKIDTTASLLGQKLRIPVIASPIARVSFLDPGGACTVARVVERFGVTQCVGFNSEPGLEATAASVEQPLIFQFTVHSDHEWIRQLLGRAKEAGYGAVCLTCTPLPGGRRERARLNHLYPTSPELSNPNQKGLDREEGRRYMSTVTWEDLAFIRETTDLPIILKEVMTPEDASLAVEHGVNVIYISNHGGHYLDHMPATIEVLPDIVKAVDGRAQVVIDSGFVRGTDVLKAIALGADAVAIGRLQCWGLAAGGEAGLMQTFEILEDEIRMSLGFLGVMNLSQLNPSYVSATTPVMYPAESAYPGIPPEVYR